MHTLTLTLNLNLYISHLFPVFSLSLSFFLFHPRQHPATTHLSLSRTLSFFLFLSLSLSLIHSQPQLISLPVLSLSLLLFHHSHKKNHLSLFLPVHSRTNNLPHAVLSLSLLLSLRVQPPPPAAPLLLSAAPPSAYLLANTQTATKPARTATLSSPRAANAHQQPLNQPPASPPQPFSASPHATHHPYEHSQPRLNPLPNHTRAPPTPTTASTAPSHPHLLAKTRSAQAAALFLPAHSPAPSTTPRLFLPAHTHNVACLLLSARRHSCRTVATAARTASSCAAENYSVDPTSSADFDLARRFRPPPASVFTTVITGA